MFRERLKSQIAKGSKHSLYWSHFAIGLGFWGLGLGGYGTRLGSRDTVGVVEGQCYTSMVETPALERKV